MKKKDLSPAEMKVMNQLCELGEADISTVQQCFAREKNWKYTTVLTIFQRLFEKKYLRRKKVGRKYVYKPVFEQSRLFQLFMQKFFGKAMEKNPVPLVNYLLATQKLSAKDKKAIEDIFLSESK
ncbi:MAG: BlaI/MecI/CopY family transcriptional regulator [bacterium]|jgi:BlaI family penicillinase repressor|nr:BlaI/MecI/CopY family transcriptional regulator [bacterium]